MQIFVRRTMTGKTVTIEVEPSSDTVDSLKAKVEESVAFPFEEQRLYFFSASRWMMLEDGHKLSEYNLVESCTLDLHWRSPRCSTCTPLDISTYRHGH